MPLRVLTFAMAFLGVLSIVLTGFLPPPEPLLVMTTLLVGFFFWNSKLHTPRAASGIPSPRTVRHRVYDMVWYLITLLFLIWCGDSLLVESFSGEDFTVRIPLAAMRLSIFLQIYKVYNRKTDRDYVHMFLLSFFQFVSSAGVSVEFHLLPLLLAYLVVATWALTLFHFRRRLSGPEAVVAAPAFVRSGRAGTGRLLTFGFFGGTFLASLLVAGLGTLLFIVFPRSATSDNPLVLEGFFGRLGPRLVSGAEGPVNLDMAGIINRSPTPVMTVALPTISDPPHTVLWRRGALHDYDGEKNRWTRPSTLYRSRSERPRGTFKTPVNILIEKSPGFFVAASDLDEFNSVEDLAADPHLIPQQFTLLYSSRGAPVYSAFSTPVAVEGGLREIGSDVNESYYCLHRTRMNETYTVYSRFPEVYSARGDGAGTTQTFRPLHGIKRRLYTALPSNLHPRYERLATQITQEFSTESQKARAIRNYLAINCLYSLDLSQKPGRNGPLYDFLFARKPGHCEYFASAMVILARELGIPSRLAYGYATGRWDPDRKLFLIRQMDAHAWAECFIEGQGWVPFDPTPPIPEDETPETFLSLLVRPFTGFFRACGEKWAEGVIGYNRFKQKGVYRFFAGTYRTISQGVIAAALFAKDLVSQPINLMNTNLLFKVLIPFVIAGFLLLPVILWLFLKRRMPHRAARRGDAFRRRTIPTVKFYLKTLRLLTHKGLRKAAADTPLEFAERAAAKSVAFSGVRTLTDLYYLVRFGNRELTDDQSRTVESILEHLRRPLRPDTSRD